MNKQQIAELVLDSRSLWQMYYVEGIVASEYHPVDFWYMKHLMYRLAGLNGIDIFGCPFCGYFYDRRNKCPKCPLDWPKSHFQNRVPCQYKLSPYTKWENTKTVEGSRAACESMIALNEKWLDENNIEYEK